MERGRSRFNDKGGWRRMSYISKQGRAVNEWNVQQAVNESYSRGIG